MITHAYGVAVQDRIRRRCLKPDLALHLDSCIEMAFEDGILGMC